MVRHYSRVLGSTTRRLRKSLEGQSSIHLCRNPDCRHAGPLHCQSQLIIKGQSPSLRQSWAKSGWGRIGHGTRALVRHPRWIPPTKVLGSKLVKDLRKSPTHTSRSVFGITPPGLVWVRSPFKASTSWRGNNNSLLSTSTPPLLPAESEVSEQRQCLCLHVGLSFSSSPWSRQLRCELWRNASEAHGYLGDPAPMISEAEAFVRHNAQD